jgi:hypothetical protein
MDEPAIKISVGLHNRFSWPNGTPIKSEVLADGRTVHLLEDGRKITVSQPNYRLEYQSTWIGAEPDETYDVNIAFVGLSLVEGFYEAWNFDMGKLRSYSFTKTHRIVHLVSGEIFTGEELRGLLPKSLAERPNGAA